MRRVVVTGLGLVTPLADGVEKTWERLLAGASGAGKITGFDPSRLTTQYACEVPLGDGSDGTFNADAYMEPKEQRKVDTFILFGMAAAQQAIEDAGWQPTDPADLERTGVMIGSGIGGLNSIANTAVMMAEKGPRRVSPFFVPGALINLISGQVSIRYGFRGPNHAPVTACSTGAHAIGDASRLIMFGDADVMIAGGMESMTNAPYLMPKMRSGARIGHAQVIDSMFLDGLEDAYDKGRLMGTFAEDCATTYQFTRGAQDDYALRSLSNALAAQDSGAFDQEITPVTLKTRTGEVRITADEQPAKARPEKDPHPQTRLPRWRDSDSGQCIQHFRRRSRPRAGTRRQGHQYPRADHGPCQPRASARPVHHGPSASRAKTARPSWLVHR